MTSTLEDVTRQYHAEQLEQAQLSRNVLRLRALHRAHRAMARAERRHDRALNAALRLRSQLEAEA